MPTLASSVILDTGSKKACRSWRGQIDLTTRSNLPINCARQQAWLLMKCPPAARQLSSRLRRIGSVAVATMSLCKTSASRRCGSYECTGLCTQLKGPSCLPAVSCHPPKASKLPFQHAAPTAQSHAPQSQRRDALDSPRTFMPLVNVQQPTSSVPCATICYSTSRLAR